LITTGSKYFFGLAGIGLLAAIVYGIVTNGVDHGGVAVLLRSDGAVDAILGPLTLGYKGGVGDHVGYAILVGFGLANLGFGVAASAFRDADPTALAELAGDDVVPPIQAPVGLNAWPFIGALAAVSVVVGLATSWVLFVIGCATAAIAAVEWTMSDWAARATVDPEVNRRVRNRVMLPVEIPVGGVILVAAIVYCLSRILLTASKDGAVLAASLVAFVIFVVAVVLGARPQIRRGAVVGALFVAALVILGLGIGGALAGPRHFEKHGTGHEGAAPAAVSTTGQEG
jgi:hypothetical protein